MKRMPYVSIVLENLEGEILLLLRDNKSTHVFPNHWTLVGRKVEDGETPKMAADRALKEETGLNASLALWKRYDREHPLFIVDQHIFVGKVNVFGGILVLGNDTQFFKPSEIQHLKIGYGFKAVLNQYFLTTIGDLHVHHA